MPTAEDNTVWGADGERGQPGSSTAGELVMATKRSLMAMRARGPSRQPGCHKLGCRDLKRNDRLEDAFRTAIGERWRCSAQP